MLVFHQYNPAASARSYQLMICPSILLAFCPDLFLGNSKSSVNTQNSARQIQEYNQTFTLAIEENG